MLSTRGGGGWGVGPSPTHLRLTGRHTVIGVVERLFDGAATHQEAVVTQHQHLGDGEHTVRRPRGQPTTWTADHSDGRPRGQTTTWTDDHWDGRPRGQTTTWTDDHWDGRPLGWTTTWTDDHVDRRPLGRTTTETEDHADSRPRGVVQDPYTRERASLCLTGG